MALLKRRRANRRCADRIGLGLPERPPAGASSIDISEPVADRTVAVLTANGSKSGSKLAYGLIYLAENACDPPHTAPVL
jgi:hypothetical protein